MSDPPSTIAELISALQASITKLEQATSFQQRKARNQAVMSRGMALKDRLDELHQWLSKNWERVDEDLYLENKAKYEAGWNALNAAIKFCDEYRALHYEEIERERSKAKPARGKKQTATITSFKATNEKQAAFA